MTIRALLACLFVCGCADAGDPARSCRADSGGAAYYELRWDEDATSRFVTATYRANDGQISSTDCTQLDLMSPPACTLDVGGIVWVLAVVGGHLTADSGADQIDLGRCD